MELCSTALGPSLISLYFAVHQNKRYPRYCRSSFAFQELCYLFQDLLSVVVVFWSGDLSLPNFWGIYHIVYLESVLHMPRLHCDLLNLNTLLTVAVCQHSGPLHIVSFHFGVVLFLYRLSLSEDYLCGAPSADYCQMPTAAACLFQPCFCWLCPCKLRSESDETHPRWSQSVEPLVAALPVPLNMALRPPTWQLRTSGHLGQVCYTIGNEAMIDQPVSMKVSTAWTNPPCLIDTRHPPVHSPSPPPRWTSQKKPCWMFCSMFHPELRAPPCPRPITEELDTCWYSHRYLH